MKAFFSQKCSLFPALAMMLIVCLIAPAFAQACGCACASGMTAPERPSSRDQETMPASCCCSGCEETPAGDLFFGGFPQGAGCDSHPVCCCETEPAPRPAAPPAVRADDLRQQPFDWRFQDAAISGLMRHSHYAGNPFFAFAGINILPTSPHIASTVLLI